MAGLLECTAADTADITAIRADAFLKSIGICSAVSRRGETLTNTAAAVHYLGIRWIRAGYESGIPIADLIELHRQTGVRFSYGLMSGGTDIARLLDGARPLASAGALIALEGNNEPFANAAGTGWCLSASFNPGLGRYLLATEHTVSHASVLGLWDAPEPWGPWTTTRLWTPEDRFGQRRPGSTLDWNDNVFFCAFAPKWFSADGLSFTLVFTGGGNGKDNDSLNTVRGTFQLSRHIAP
jgi:hypothetical protein